MTMSETGTYVSFLQALHDKYSDEEYQLLFTRLPCDFHTKSPHVQEKISGGESRTMPKLPSCVILQNFRIALVESECELVGWCSHLTEVDLSFNRIDRGSQVWPLISGVLPYLVSLNLSFNPLSSIQPEDWPSGGDMNEQIDSRQLRRLVLNGTHIAVKAILALLPHLPRLDELHISLNDYVTLPEVGSGQTINVVSTLYIDSNNLADFDDILHVGRYFPNLQTLFASHNPLRNIKNADGCKMMDSLAKLRKLHINRIEIDEWFDLDRLNNLPQLKDLRLMGCSLWNAESCDSASSLSDQAKKLQRLPARQEVICCLPGVEVLNGTAVGNLERMDAEQSFVRYYSNSIAPPNLYARLVMKHGQLLPLAEIELTPPRIVEIHLSFGSVHKKPYKLNVRQTVGNLKKILEALTGMSPAKSRLFYVDSEMPDGYAPNELRYAKRAVHSYCMKPGDELVVLPK